MQSLRGVVQAPISLSAVPLSVVVRGSSIVFAAYVEETNHIVLEEFVEANTDVAERVVAVVRPTLILCSAKTAGDETLMQALTSPTPAATVVGEDDGNDEATAVSALSQQDPQADPDGPTTVQAGGSIRTIPYRIMKTADYDVRTSKSLIMKLRVESVLQQHPEPQQYHPFPMQQQPRTFPLAQHNTQQDAVYRLSNYHALATMINFDSSAQVQALGALLRFLKTSNFQIDAGGGAMVVTDIVPANISMYMKISADSLSALQIFATEHHPLVASKGSGNSKEGFSLFSLLDKTHSAAGRRLLREWMLKPLVDVPAIQFRQDGVELFLLPDMREITAQLCRLLQNIGSVDKIMQRLKKCIIRPNDYVALSKALSSAVMIIDTLREDVLWKVKQRAVAATTIDTEYGGELGQLAGVNYDANAEHHLVFLEDVLNRADPEALQNLLETLSNVLDEARMAEDKGAQVVIRQGFSEQLDVFRHVYDTLNAKLLSVISIVENENPHLREMVMSYYFAQLGFFVAISNQLKWKEDGVLPDDFVFVFHQGGLSFFKADIVTRLDDEIGDILPLMRDLESTILADLEENILDCDAQIRSSFEVLAELDCILSFANSANDGGYVRPDILPAEERRIEILSGRHPLQELIVRDTFVPNDVRIDETRRVNVVTGPNFSGKSCYARQVGVLTFMAQIGSFVPCDAARISVVDTILTRFSSLESCTVPQSSFQLDLTQLGGILRQASKDSLVVIDEFGKGTSPASGIALLATALKHLAASGARVVCTTHFLEVFSMKLVEHGAETGVQALQMKVSIPEDSDKLAVPLFALEEGVANSSAGIVCASMAGVKKTVIERAGEIVNAAKNNEKVQPLVEILRQDLGFSDVEKCLLGKFLDKDWSKASEAEIDEVLSMVSSM